MKNNIITIGQVKLSEVEISNVAIPKAGIVQSVNKAARYGSDKKRIDGSCSKIVCEFVDSALAKILEKSNADVSELKTTTLEIVGNEQELLDIDTDELMGAELPLSNAKIMLKWDSNSSAWRGLKLVIDLKNLNEKEAKDNE